MTSLPAIVFDLYGTLFDVHSVAAACEAARPGRGMEISALWRQKQLEYTWLRSLMGRYVPFETATEDALRFVDARLGLGLGEALMAQLAEGYFHLAPYPEAPAVLRELRASGHRLAILSNGSHRSIEAVVRNAGLTDAFDHLLSVEDVGVFKPDARVYAIATSRFACAPADVLFVSSNAWDVSGAGHFGFSTCWVNRQGAPMDELGIAPGRQVRDLTGLVQRTSS